MKKFEFNYAINTKTDERIDDINRSYENFDTLEGMLEQMADDYAESCLLLNEENRSYDLDNMCVKMTFSNIETDEIEDHIIYAKEIEA